MKMLAPIETIKKFFKLGASPEDLAATSTAAIVVGIMPVFGITTALMGVISARMKLSFPLMYALSYIVYPLQILLLIPFMHFGEWVTGSEPTELSFQEMKEAFTTDFAGAMADFGLANLQAVLGWLLICLPMTFLLQKLLKRAYHYFFQRKITAQAASQIS